MGGAVSSITDSLMGDPAQNNFSGNYDVATNGMNSNIAAQNDLAKQIQTQAASGASPADIMLQQANNQNLQQTQGLIGSQKGINPGLAARSAAQAGASINQQAAGQMAAQRAQEGINANQLQSSIYGNIGNEYGNAQKTAADSSLAQNGANAAATGGLLGGLSSVAGGLFAHGGEVKPRHYDAGGPVSSYGQRSSPFFNPYTNQQKNTTAPGTPSAALGQSGNVYQGMSNLGTTIGKGIMSAGNALFGSSPNQDYLSNHTDYSGTPAPIPEGNYMVTGDSLGTMAGGAGDSPININDPSQLTEYAANGGMIKGETYAALGKMIPGKAKSKGNDLKNDTVPAMLSPQEIILPRSVTLHPDAPEKAKQFVAAVLAKKMRGKK